MAEPQQTGLQPMGPQQTGGTHNCGLNCITAEFTTLFQQPSYTLAEICQLGMFSKQRNHDA
ncbi:hypothetical protein RMSM_03800 [Rhodopirellula maiorica SM1]|uniref:Uncharacterized protein n=1 Tax=Rhodopirellula maiorica SM1 TaxID=1265738 RepID=M5RZB8_9BACT|nr:hypothetical protein RMSM_03800 [Rhodopirellula maiorica SM1]